MEKGSSKEPHSRQQILQGLQQEKPRDSSSGNHNGLIVAGVVVAVVVVLALIYRTYLIRKDADKPAHRRR